MKKVILKQTEGYAPSLSNPDTGKPMYCPLESSDNPTACGGWCAWFDIQAKNMGGDPPLHVTCKGVEIAEVVNAPKEEKQDGTPRIERVIRALGIMGVRHGDTDASSLYEIAEAVLRAADDLEGDDA